MATISYQTQLEMVQSAITAILNNAQEVTIKGRSYEYADLNTLQSMETRLRAMAARESTGGIRVRGITPTE